MNRYRAQSQENHCWVYGWLFGQDTKTIIIEDSRYDNPVEQYETIPVDEETIGARIGLYDKNGKEIFEGDIVKGSAQGSFGTFYYFGAVVFCDEIINFGYWVDNGEDSWDIRILRSGTSLHQINGEIIGNIHDHPKLLAELLADTNPFKGS